MAAKKIDRRKFMGGVAAVGAAAALARKARRVTPVRGAMASPLLAPPAGRRERQLLYVCGAA